MFIGSFIGQYFLMPPIIINGLDLHTNNLGKAYMSTIMALFMVLLEVVCKDIQYHVFSLNSYALFGALIGLFIYLYYKQIAITDKEYLKGMVEHHSMAIFTSQEILKKTDDYNVAKLAKNIIQTQKDEIREMVELVKKM
jgi:hypothetical protein